MTARVGENGPTKKTAGTSLPDSGAERESGGFGHYLVSQISGGMIYSTLLHINRPTLTRVLVERYKKRATERSRMAAWR